MSELWDKLAAYRSHKVVHAGEIVAVLASSRKVHVSGADGSALSVQLTEEQWNRGGRTPQEGDRVVLYPPDGYLSISPRQNFEDGYERE